MVFSQEAIKRLLEDHGEKSLAEGAEKKGTLIFTGTLGALRCNAEFGSYGASRGSVRQLAQALAKEMSPKGIHVAVSVSQSSSFCSRQAGLSGTDEKIWNCFFSMWICYEGA